MFLTRTLLLAVLLCPAVFAQTAGTITFTANTTSANGSVVPVLTWSTAPAATSCTASGDWTGTKAAAGTATLAAITASKTYSLSCSWGSGTSSLTLKWVAPTQNTDGSPLTDLKFYSVYYGQDVNSLTLNKTVGPTLTSVVLDNLAPGTWYATLRAVNQYDIASSRSAVVSKAVTGSGSATESISITVRPVPKAPTTPTLN